MNRDNYIRVTDALKPYNGYGSAPAHVMAKYQDRGTRVHAACELYMQGHSSDAVCFALEPEDVPYFVSFQQWYKGYPVLEHEKRYWDDTLQITGQLDMITELDGRLAIVDIKTSKVPNKTWGLQLSAYKNLAQEYPVKKLVVVRLNHDGTPPEVIEYEDEYNLFLDALRLYKKFMK